MKILFNPVFIICLLLFAIDQLLERSGIFIPFVHSYLDDLACMPVILTLSLGAMRFLYRDNLKRLSISQVTFALIYCIILFEFILPRFSTTYTADYWDIPVYAIGAVIFYLFVNPSKYTQKYLV